MISRNNNKAFTLVELLTVIAIIGILTAILIPTTGKALESARKSKAANNLRQIALAHLTYSTLDGEAKFINKPTIHEWAAVLAQHANLNDPKIWILKEDPLIQKISSPTPTHIATPSNPHKSDWSINHDFKKFPLSFTVANAISPNANPSTTPIAWTRGLNTSGTWNPLHSQNPGVYGDKGGHIVFLDGHVIWFSNLNNSDSHLTHYITHKPTSNILHALPPGASILDSQNIHHNKPQ